MHSQVRDKQFYLAMAFFETLKKIRNQYLVAAGANTIPIEQEYVTYIDFGLCLPDACDFHDLIGSVALPALLNRTKPVRFMPVGLSVDWFITKTHQATRCKNVEDATRPFFPDGAAMPWVDVVQPALQ